MSRILEGMGASAGRALGPVRRIDWDIPLVPHRTIRPEEVDGEVERFGEARARALEFVSRLQEETSRRIGSFEGKVFESQAMMIEDPELIEGTLSYVRDNFVCAERAFDWQVLEMRIRIQESAHAMLVDRLADLHDVRVRVLSHLLGRSDPSDLVTEAEEPSILVGSELPPSIAARLDPQRVLGVVLSGGSRGAHGVILARALGIPVVVAAGAAIQAIEESDRLLVDGRTGEIRVNPSSQEVEGYHRAVAQASHRRERLQSLAGRPTETSDGVHTVVQANLDLPHEAADAVRLGADGVGLFRSEFLVIGRREIPGEEDQLQAYRAVLEAFPEREVTLRTFDIGGDKFPLFLSLPPEDNPYLGWRAIRICLDMPELFDNQLRAAVRAVGENGNLRLLIPFVSTVEEMRRTRESLAAVYGSLGLTDSGIRIPVGVMVETPAAVEILDLLAPYVDFVSLGTNDLTQYVLAADRGNAKLGKLYDPLHPALLRMYKRVVKESARHELDLSVCGELAGDPVGVAALLGLGYRKFSVSIVSLPEIRELIRNVSVKELRRVMRKLDRAESGDEVRRSVHAHLSDRGVLSEPAPVGLSKD
ncbi:MAG: phosphoenolpyruvate--protein phosphotransferase [marine benthic group bacterium]|nr:phosphoenolpyruvate--protein phosphotransferase [Candidatus Benthicola marisminoris]